MRIFDRDRGEWVGREQEREVAALHRRDAARQRTAVRGTVAVLAACGLAFGTWALGWKDEPEATVYFVGPESADGASAGDTASGDTYPDGTASPSPSSTDGALGSEAAPPRGYETVTDLEGFRSAVPVGWSRTSTDAIHGFDIVHYRNADRTRRLQVYEVSEPTPYESLEVYVDDPRVKEDSGFQKLSLKRLDVDGRPAARLTYLKDEIDGEPDVGGWYIVDHRFQAADGKLYALTGYGPESEGRDAVRELVTNALDWFCPPLTQCPAPGGG
ncbi:hypothetical protein RB200_30675 [Streptomyces sp. PmtG]